MRSAQPAPRRPGERPPIRRAPTVEASRRRITVEILIFALLCLVVGGAIVAVQVARKGESILTFDPHARSNRVSDGR